MKLPNRALGSLSISKASLKMRTNALFRAGSLSGLAILSAMSCALSEDMMAPADLSTRPDSICVFSEMNLEVTRHLMTLRKDSFWSFVV